MNKNTLTFVVFSFFVTLLWIGYSIYAAFFVDTYSATSENISVYLKPVETDMHIDTLDKVNALGKNIRVPSSSLK